MKNLYINRSLFLSLLGVSGAVWAQDSKAAFVNQGKLSVATGGVIATLYSFDNQKDAQATNDGTAYYYRDFNNDGNYTFTSTKKGSTAVFTRYENEQGAQTISGSAMSDFYDVELNNKTPKVAFDLQNNMDVFGTMNFQEGIIKVDSLITPAAVGRARKKFLSSVMY